ncbi:molybdate ABC transporter substrate-binding protein [Cohnella panacarvi]|uniref:molybdate ABC transporter substrate-binding protein n=1 Tax=Cohnella panacarvi TaxID=400776 RepID=UPI0012EBDF38
MAAGIATGCGRYTTNSEGNVVLTISAAASLTDALTEVQQRYESSHDSIKLRFNFAASGTLQQQIEQGAPIDIFLSASETNMDKLVEKQLIATGKHANLLSNSLVVIVPKSNEGAITRLEDLRSPGVVKLAIGIPEIVPAGGYAVEALTGAGLWDALSTKTVQAKDVRQVLQYVETGNVEAGFVYKTDALASNRADIAFAVDPASYKPIVYPIGVVRATKHRKEADEVFDYLRSDEAMDIFRKYGFEFP